MIAQFIFLYALQILGILFGIAFKKNLHITFISLSGLLWGQLFWVIAAMLLVIFGLPFSLPNMLIVLGVFTGLIIFRMIQTKAWSLSTKEIKGMGFWLLISGIIFAFFCVFNFSNISPDSMYLILNGRALASEGLTDFVHAQLTLRGIFVQLLQSASTFIGVDYLYALQPVNSIIFFILFYYLGTQILSQSPAPKNAKWVIGIALTAFASTYFILFQTIYIHTNLMSGLYLFVACCGFWLALQNKGENWILFAMLALTAFSLLRTEAPLFAIIFIMLLISDKNISYTTRTAVGLPYSIFMMGWYVFILTGMGNDSYILTPFNTLLIITILVALAVFTLLTKQHWIDSQLRPHIPRLMLMGITLLVVVLFALDSSQMMSYLNTLLLNSVLTLWGGGWLILACGACLIVLQPKIPHEYLFSMGISIFFLMLVSVASRSEIHRFNWGDSSNRMLTHIYPTIFLYFAIKFSQGLTMLENGKNKNSKIAAVLFVFATGMITLTLTYFLFR